MINLLQRIDPLSKTKMLIYYLGNKCNFDCTYCDRGYIEKLGGQSANNSTVEGMRDFTEWAAKQKNEITQVSFHGGEPLLFIKRMDEMMSWLLPIAENNNWKISITTNGSLIEKNKWFFEKYSNKLTATISYDFMFQEKNREQFDIYSMAKVLNDHTEYWKWQFVLPIDDPRSLSLDSIKSVVSTCYKTNCRIVNIIPLRHHRGKDKFEVLLDNINLEQYFGAFLDYIQILYIKKINVFIDGNYYNIDKAYFGEHNKVILSPDGYIYPEFDFLEYKVENARIGSWRNKQIWKPLGDESRIHKKCESCEMKPSCGLKYLYKLFGTYPSGKCQKFYEYTNMVIMHNSELKKQKNLVSWIGIDEEFPINE
jgi:MoaA/NifB/PqqE/SkfB family radical SAM enzyme